MSCFEELKKKANYTLVEREVYEGPFRKVKKTVWRISRPFMWDSFPACWNYIKPFLNKSYPDGDVLYGSSDTMENTPENIRLLENWVGDMCFRCGGVIEWFEGDKRASYRCWICGDETPFVKGAWAYD